MTHRKSIADIEGLDWKSFDPFFVVFISFLVAKEFADSLRAALRVFPDSADLQKMAAGELKTNNLQFEDYTKTGDHWEFLEHFLLKRELNKSLSRQRSLSYVAYLKTFKAFSSEQKAMTIFSREIELSSIFHKILAAHDWKTLGFEFYAHYLTKHIELDSTEGGHADLTSSFPLDPATLDTFWEARLKFYRDFLEPTDLQT